MKVKLLAAACLVTGFTTVLTACDVEQTREGSLPDVDVDVKSGQLPEYEVKKTQEGKLPDVDVDVKGGQLPAYDIDTPDVDIGTKEIEVEVPDVDVSTKKKTITVPDVDIEMPSNDNE